MRLKGKPKTNKLLSVIIASVGLFIFSFVIQGCQESLDATDILQQSDGRYIDIANLSNPETLMGTDNAKDYLEAYGRFMKHATILNNKLHFSIKRGSQINISENLYNYISSYLETVNQKINRGKLVVFEENGEIKIVDKRRLHLVRLKSGDEGDAETTPIPDPIDFCADEQDVGDEFVDAFSSFINDQSASYNTNDYFDTNSGGFSITDMQASGSFTSGGYTYDWGFTDITAGGTNNLDNSICTDDVEHYDSETVFMLRYCSGNSAANIQAHSTDAAAHMYTLIYGSN